MSYKLLLFKVEEALATITLNRPEVLNSFNRAMALELQAALLYCQQHSEVRAILLTGQGRAFCSGQDLSEVCEKRATPPDLGEIVNASYTPIVRLLRDLEKPVVCAVNGVAAGAGANLALACALVLASREASFIQSFSKIGLIPDTGGTFFLPRFVGFGRAGALMLLGDKLPAEEAVAIGLIYKVCDPASLLEEAASLAKRLATQPTRGLGLIKRALNASAANSLDAQLELEASLQAQAGQTQDYQEGIAAFLEKRKPHFTGR